MFDLLSKDPALVKTWPTIILYPYKHLTHVIIPSQLALKKCHEAQKIFRDSFQARGHTVISAEFGWIKRDTYTTRSFLEPYPIQTLYYDSKFIEKEKDKVNLIPSKSKFLYDEKAQPKKVKLINLLINNEAVDEIHSTSNYEYCCSNYYDNTSTLSDKGHLLLKPKLTHIKYSLRLDLEKRLYMAYPQLYQIQSSALLSTKPEVMQEYLGKFPSNMYYTEDKQLFLRFATCPMMLDHMASQIIGDKKLPLVMYEYAQNCYRLEKSGEISGLHRLRGFTMPDMHVATTPQASLQEFEKLVLLSIIFLRDLEITPHTIITIRCLEAFYHENHLFFKGLQNKIKSILGNLSEPILYELWETQKYYFTIKFEMNMVCNQQISQLSTVQLDQVYPRVFNVKYIDVNQNRTNVSIIHAAVGGSMERLCNAVLQVKSPGYASTIRIIPLMIFPEEIITAIDNLKTKIPLELDDRPLSFNKKIAICKKNKLNYIILGDLDYQNKSYTLNMINAQGNYSSIIVNDLRELEQYIHNKLIKFNILPSLSKTFKVV